VTLKGLNFADEAINIFRGLCLFKFFADCRIVK